MTDEEAFRQLVDSDEPAAHRAFDHLYKSYHSFAQSALRGQFSACNANDLEDVTQRAFFNLWQNRRQITVVSLPDWRGLLRTTLRNCYIDMVRARRSPPPEILPPVPPPGPGPIVQEEDLRLLGRAANACWLGLPLSTPEREHNRRLLAAQLFYQEEASVEEILDILNRRRFGAHPLSHTTVADWLDDPAVLRHLAYTSLYYSPLALTLHLLDLPDETQAGVLDAMIAGATPEAALPLRPDWTPQEVHAILWRYYRNAFAQREPGIPQSELSVAEQEQFFVICNTFFPFYGIMKEVINFVNGRIEEICGTAHPGLWRRLAFQYRYLDDLAHRDIEERIEPASQQVGVRVSQIVLQGWLSSGRLLKALEKTMAGRFEENYDE